MTAAVSTTPVVLTLDELAALRCHDLAAVFREGLVPDRFSALNGRPRGRVLAVPRLDRSPLRQVVRLIAGSRVFPWEGKNFASTGKKTGIGRNRVNLFLRDVEWFPFKVKLESSQLDGKPCVRLDYGQPGNPWPVSRIRDELREVSPGLYLGVTLWQVRSDAVELLWFAIDARIQC
jgi:hypothetical protein